MEEVRPATREDLPRLLELFATAREELAGYRGRWYELDALPEPVAGEFARAMQEDDSLLLMGTVHGYPVAWLMACLETTLPQAPDPVTGRIRVYVEPEARELGVGEALLDEARPWLLSKGARAADIHVSPGHRAAKNFCEGQGFVARALVMHSRL